MKKCVKCDPSCERCVNSGRYNCLSCKSGFFSYKTDKTQLKDNLPADKKNFNQKPPFYCMKECDASGTYLDQ